MPEDHDALWYLNRAVKEFDGYDDYIGNGHTQEAELAFGRARAALTHARDQLVREQK